jgi:putative ABC transport system substrate-binding protein
MRRREFLALVGGAAASWPLATHAQQPERMRCVGVLNAFPESDSAGQQIDAAFRRRLEDLGWTAGRNVRFEHRWAGTDADRREAFARELVAIHCDVIVGVTTPVVAALLRQTRTIPIVFTQVSDPVGSGFVASLSRPGGNVTGFINLESSLGSKWVELLKELAPGVERVALMFNPKMAPYAEYYVRPFQAAAPSFAVSAITVPVHDAVEIEGSMATLAQAKGGGLIVMPDTFTWNRRKLIVSLAARYHLPAIYPFREFVNEGGLISYGVDAGDLRVRAATYVDKILKGAKPADLPVQLPTKFELVINLKTAKALGLAVPSSLLAWADEVIE